MSNRLDIGVIPAAGTGKRLGYLTHILPKTMFPLYDRPILHHVINRMEGLGISDIYIIVNEFKEIIVKYCERVRLSIKPKLHFVEQIPLDGTAGAILRVQRLVKNKPFLTIYGDDCTITDSFQDMIDFFFATQAVVVEAVIKDLRKRILRQTCCVKLGKDNRMIEILEKPDNPPYIFRGCGVYLFRPEIFQHIRSTPMDPVKKEREITHTINAIAKKGNAYGFPLRGYNININDYNDLLEASESVKRSH